MVRREEREVNNKRRTARGSEQDITATGGGSRVALAREAAPCKCKLARTTAGQPTVVHWRQDARPISWISLARPEQEGGEGAERFSPQNRRCDDELEWLGACRPAVITGPWVGQVGNERVAAAQTQDVQY